ncbi:cell division protein FtsK [Terribacillus saccharophilus]|uniref:helicase HerA domain-containing protein n=1 Tax=Terribacillus saccharophilus TaxID=361277 RepID=UPI000BA77D53|nr:DUF87 domain-containing protein [Terribacillus saccharophilus]PAF20323.1 cell division protein FtsK [Terribacillus saccharophilus]
MKRTYRMQRGYVSFSIVAVCLVLWVFFYKPYPLLVQKITLIQLPRVESSIFLILAALMLFGILVCWAVRNKLWFGISYSLQYYLLVKRIRRHIKDARFEDERELDNRFVILPKINIIFDDNRTRKSGKIFIRNSIKFDKKLESMRIDSALSGYVCERNYLSTDRDYYIFEFYSNEVEQQLEIKSANDLIVWASKTAKEYDLRIDERTTVPFHHMGLVGQTGSGKSFFIQMLCEQIVSKQVQHELYIVDPKRSDVYQMAERFVGKQRTADKANAVELIKNFHQRMAERQNELQSYFRLNRNKTYKEAGLPALILLIDEFGALRDSWKTLSKKERDEIDSVLADVAFMGRQLGCILWIATQQMNAQTMPTAIREQLVLKIALGDSDEQTYRTLFASGVNIPPVRFSAGKGIFSYPSLANVENPRLLIVPYCSFMN